MKNRKAVYTIITLLFAIGCYFCNGYAFEDAGDAVLKNATLISEAYLITAGGA